MLQAVTYLMDDAQLHLRLWEDDADRFGKIHAAATP